MFLFYSLIYIVVLIFLFPFQYLKRPKDLRRKWLREKFGVFTPSDKRGMGRYTTSAPQHSTGEFIWIHAVSVGEVIASLPLLKTLRTKYPSKDIILSTVTDTGQKVAEERAPEGTRIIYLPFDISLIIKTVLKKIHPELLIVIETELWPNLFKVFKENRIPILVLNGRISESSFKGYKKISFFMKKVLSYVDFFGMQEEVYAERIRRLGVNENKVTNMGNFKFDTKPPSQIPEWTSKIRGPVIIAGSTHEGEEAFITSIYNKLKKDFPELNLIIAPRRPERFQEVANMLKSKDVSFIRRSEIEKLNLELKTLNGEIMLLDTIGELSAVYHIADIALIGKSFKGYGGQNPFEPAYWGKPILCGPHMENFPVIQDFYKQGAAFQVNEQELYTKLKELLLSPKKTKEIGLKAQELYKKNTGAVERATDVIGRFLSG